MRRGVKIVARPQQRHVRFRLRVATEGYRILDSYDGCRPQETAEQLVQPIDACRMPIGDI